MTKDTAPHYLPFIESSSIHELKLALLRSIDFARKCGAEVAEMKAQLDRVIGYTAKLEAENTQLRDFINGDSQKRNPEGKQ